MSSKIYAYSLARILGVSLLIGTIVGVLMIFILRLVQGASLTLNDAMISSTIVSLLVLYLANKIRTGTMFVDLQDHRSKYLDIPELQDSTSGVTPYVRNKVVIVNKKSREVERQLQLYLPEAIRATEDQEVGTIVWLEEGFIKVGEYDGGTWAQKVVWDITLIDKSIPAILDKQSFVGGEPPVALHHGSIGDRPDDKLTRYLRQLRQV